MIDEMIGNDLVLGIGSKIDSQGEHHTQQQKAEAEAQPMHKFQLPKKGQAHKNPNGKDNPTDTLSKTVVWEP